VRSNVCEKTLRNSGFFILHIWIAECPASDALNQVIEEQFAFLATRASGERFPVQRCPNLRFPVSGRKQMGSANQQIVTKKTDDICGKTGIP